MISIGVKPLYKELILTDAPRGLVTMFNGISSRESINESSEIDC